MSKRNKKLEKIARGNLTPAEEMHLGVSNVNDNAYVALKYYDPSYECFSCWDKDELKAFSNFVTTVNQHNWQQIFSTGGKRGSKKGLGLTLHRNKDDLPDNQALNNISKDITFFELRVTKKARAHGFRVKSAFFLIWLDRNHEIYPE